MAADYNKPVTTDNYAVLIAQLRDNIAAAQNMLDDLTGVTNIPTGALRYDQTAKKFQIYNGTTFVDTVLSKEAGGTGITNWVKATTGEAESGTADRYPDAEKVKESIAANGFKGSAKETIWTGSAASVDLNSISGGYPGDGIYFVTTGLSNAMIYFDDGVFSCGISNVTIDVPSKEIQVHTVQKTTSNIVEVVGIGVDLNFTNVFGVTASVLKIEKLIQG